MKRKKLLSTLYFLVFFAQINYAQQFVKVQFEDEGIVSDMYKSLKIEFKIGDSIIEPLMFLNGFIVPEFNNITKIDIYVAYKGKKIYFKNIATQKFSADWTIGIDKKPFKQENPVPQGHFKIIYYIKFEPKGGGVGTYVFVTE